MITEQIIPHDELLDAVHQASVDYVEADRALQNYNLAVDHSTPESRATLEELQRIAHEKSQALREAQVQLLLSNPSL